MIFYGQGIVWDKEFNKLLCEFKNGQFETKDLRVVNILSELGYDCDKEELLKFTAKIEEVKEPKIEVKKPKK